MKYLDLTTEQSQALAAGQEVEVWERMDPEPPEDATEVFVWFAGDLRNAPNGCAEDGAYFVTRRGLEYLGPAPYPPGTRARVRESLIVVNNGGDPVEIGHVYSGIPDAWVEEYVDQPPLPRWADVPACKCPDWAIRMDATSTTARPDRRGDEWGFVTGWVKA